MSVDRKSERRESHIVLSYKSVDESTFNSSQLLDISSDGLQFTTSRFYPIKTRIEVHVIVPTSYPNKLTIYGTVSHCKEKMKELLYDTGLVFSANSQETTREINKYIAYLSEHDPNYRPGGQKKDTVVFSEKRRGRRLKSQVIIQYIELSGMDIKTSQIVDISRGGLLFNSDVLIDKGRQIRIKMIVPTTFPNAIKVEGTVRHSMEIIKGNLFQTGIEFSREYPEVLEQLGKYIDYLEKKDGPAKGTGKPS